MDPLFRKSRASGPGLQEPARPLPGPGWWFDGWASKVTQWAGSPLAFALALASLLAWLLAGPLFHYSENWQLVVNTGTTIVTFLMVFLIQHSQNKDAVAIHLKLNELLAASRLASNRMIGIEHLDEKDLQQLAQFYARLAEQVKQSGERGCHSIDEEAMPPAAAFPVNREGRRA